MDLPSDFMHTPMDHKYPEVHMALKGKLAELILKVYYKLYRKIFSTDRKGRMILYVEMQKDLYVILKPALMFYIKLVGNQTRSGFKLNPYDPCAMKLF